VATPEGWVINLMLHCSVASAAVLFRGNLFPELPESVMAAEVGVADCFVV
jgi:hypothetical protein